MFGPDVRTLACSQTLKVPETAVSLVEGNFTYFFDIDSDGRDAQWLRTIILFAEPPGDKTYENRMIDGAAAPPETHAGPPVLPFTMLPQQAGCVCTVSVLLLCSRLVFAEREAGVVAENRPVGARA